MLLISDLSEISEPVEISTVKQGTLFSLADLPNTLCIKVDDRPDPGNYYHILIYNFAANEWDVNICSTTEKVVVHQIEFEK